jgi:hypothetical protein
MREIILGIALVSVLILGIGFLFAGRGEKLSPRDQVLLNEMKQLREFFQDNPIQPAMPDHLIKELSDGTGLFFHFDKPVGQESMILWMGSMILGKFCIADQERVQSAQGPGFVHFHQKRIPGSDAMAGHGGKGGEEGYWFRHIAVTNIPQGDMMAGTGAPWGPVNPGIDMDFMPTPAPEC